MEVNLIIFEGPDGAGKSTLAKFLSYVTNKKLVSNTHSDPCDLKWFLNQLDKESCIIDRTFISEIVYSEAKNRERRITNRDIDILVDKLLEKRALIVYCTNRYELLVDRAFSRGEDYVNKEELRRVIELYDYVFDDIIMSRGISVLKINSFLNIKQITSLIGDYNESIYSKDSRRFCPPEVLEKYGCGCRSVHSGRHSCLSRKYS